MIGRSSSRSIVLLASLGVGIATSAPGQAELPVAMQVELEDLRCRWSECADDGDWVGALAAIDASIALAPSAKLHMQRAQFLRPLGRKDEQIAAHREALRSLPEGGDVAKLEQRLLEGLEGEREQEGQAAEKAVREKPDRADSWAQRAHFRLSYGLLDLAGEDCRKAIELDPAHALAHAVRAQLLARQGAPPADVLAAVERALEFDPDQDDLVTLRRAARRALHDWDGLILELGRAIAAAPEDWRAFAQRAEAHLGKGDADAALADCGAALALSDGACRAARHLRAEAWTLKARRPADGVSFSDELRQLVTDANERIERAPADRAAWLEMMRVYMKEDDDWTLVHLAFMEARSMGIVPNAEMYRLGIIAAIEKRVLYKFAPAQYCEEAIGHGFKDPFIYCIYAAYAFDHRRDHDGQTELTENYSVAIRACELLIGQFPGTPDAELAMLRLLRMEEERPDAPECMEMLDRLIAAHPGSIDLRTRRVQRNLDRARLAKACEDLDALVEAQPDATNTLCLRGEVRMRLGALEPALADFDAALALDPKLLDAVHGRMAALWRLRRVDETMGMVDRCLELQPRDALAFLQRGEIRHLELYELDAAYADFKRAVAIDSGEPVKSICDEAMRRVLRDESTHKYFGSKLMAAAAKGEPQPMFDRAKQYLDGRDFREASEGFTWLAQLRPHDLLTQFWAGTSLMDACDYPAAVSYLKRAVALDPAWQPAHRNLGLSYALWSIARKASEQRALAIEELQTAIRLDPNDAGGYWGLAKLYDDMGDYERARSYNEKLTALAAGLAVNLDYSRRMRDEQIAAARETARQQAEAAAFAQRAAEAAEQEARFAKFRAAARDGSMGDAGWASNWSAAAALQRKIDDGLQQAAALHEVERRFGYYSQAAESARRNR